MCFKYSYSNNNIYIDGNKLKKQYSFHSPLLTKERKSNSNLYIPSRIYIYTYKNKIINF